MAKVKGIIPVVGTIGGINFYYRKGELIARKAGGGFNREAIKKSPTMKKVRQQNTEFAHCSAVNKAFKQALKPILHGYNDGSLHSRLMSMFLKIKTLDAVNERGNRSITQGIKTPLGKKMLADFDFTPKRVNLLPAHTSFDWNTSRFTVNGFDINRVKFPNNASFIEVQLQLISFDFKELVYSQSELASIELWKDFTKSEFSLTSHFLENKGDFTFVIVRTSFFQDINGSRFLLSGESNIGIRIISIKI